MAKPDRPWNDVTVPCEAASVPPTPNTELAVALAGVANTWPQWLGSQLPGSVHVVAVHVDCSRVVPEYTLLRV
jgi:hypothetical protein